MAFSEPGAIRGGCQPCLFYIFCSSVTAKARVPRFRKRLFRAHQPTSMRGWWGTVKAQALFCSALPRFLRALVLHADKQGMLVVGCGLRPPGPGSEALDHLNSVEIVCWTIETPALILFSGISHFEAALLRWENSNIASRTSDYPFWKEDPTAIMIGSFFPKYNSCKIIWCTHL